ncbi:hypothetical protein B0H15DRAFT_957288 [Mycena belliarum]|uniref:Glutaminase A central domain-containing protein n=1 Tax=Mycena belliarum TaxID=1033014 RepID=A0AAD6XEF0_9AGAR|nr:hypothetical protein B0H15DRAFT_957288 [Mycena belliae]
MSQTWDFSGEDWDRSFLNLDPLARYQATGLCPNKWSVHDMGAHYPKAAGHPDGGDEAISVKGALPFRSLAHFGESSNMLIMWISYTRASGDLAQITRYFLIADLPIPMSLSTDDFAGRLANQTNIAIKGIIGIRAMAEIEAMLGDKAKAPNYRVILTDYLPAPPQPARRALFPAAAPMHGHGWDVKSARTSPARTPPRLMNLKRWSTQGQAAVVAALACSGPFIIVSSMSHTRTEQTLRVGYCPDKRHIANHIGLPQHRGAAHVKMVRRILVRSIQPLRHGLTFDICSATSVTALAASIHGRRCPLCHEIASGALLRTSAIVSAADTASESAIHCAVSSYACVSAQRSAEGDFEEVHADAAQKGASDAVLTGFFHRHRASAPNTTPAANSSQAKNVVSSLLTICALLVPGGVCVNMGTDIEYFGY